MVSNEKKLIRLIQVIDLRVEQQMKVLAIRNEDGVRKWMYTDHIIKTDEHLMWISKLVKDDRNIVFAVIDGDDNPLGVVSINAIDRKHKRADWAFYLTRSIVGHGLGSALEWAIIDFVFNKLGLEKLNAEVIEGNESVLRLHQKFGFKQEGIREAHIIKNGKRCNVVLIGLSWAERYKPIFQGDWDIKIQYDRKIAFDPISDIESARARNNVNWMNIMRLAFQKSPEVAKQIIKSIHEQDKIIANLTDKLVVE